jgi:hypothetical protein
MESRSFPEYDYTPRCSHSDKDGEICLKKGTTYSFRKGQHSCDDIFRTLCSEHINTCYYIDKNGKQCQCTTNCKGPKKPRLYCPRHLKLAVTIEKLRRWKEILRYFDDYVFHGETWEKSDDDGSIPIYLFRKKSSEYSDDQDHLYDDEIWEWDEKYPYVRFVWDDTLKTQFNEEFPEGFDLLDKCEEEALC